jgi:CheY-like chemotaxis protein
MKKLILVVDNDTVTLTLIQAMLASEGFDVVTATSGLMANKYIYDARVPDLILLDVMMPFCDGTKKVEFIKEREASREIPVVLISGKPASELKELAEQSGAEGYLPKPIKKIALLAEIARHLRHSTSQHR